MPLFCSTLSWLLSAAPLAALPTPSLLTQQIESVLSRKASGGLDASITSYPKQAHGFSLRGDATDAAVAQAASSAFGAGRAFLDKHLK